MREWLVTGMPMDRDYDRILIYLPWLFSFLILDLKWSKSVYSWLSASTYSPLLPVSCHPWSRLFLFLLCLQSLICRASFPLSKTPTPITLPFTSWRRALSKVLFKCKWLMRNCAVCYKNIFIFYQEHNYFYDFTKSRRF